MTDWCPKSSFPFVVF